MTITENASEYIVTYATTAVVDGYSGNVGVSESCDLAGTTEANCVEVLSASIDGTSTKLSTSWQITGTAYQRFDVAITAGASKTASATGSCSGSSSGASLQAGTASGLTAAGVALVVGVFGGMLVL